MTKNRSPPWGDWPNNRLHNPGDSETCRVPALASGNVLGTGDEMRIELAPGLYPFREILDREEILVLHSFNNVIMNVVTCQQ